MTPFPIEPSDLDGWRRGDPAEHIEAADEESLRSAARAIISQYLNAPDWHRDAECAGVPLDVFFPSLGGSTRHALELCGLCSVRTECLAAALADPDLDHGVRGGMSAQARKQRRRSMKDGGAS